MTPRISVVIPAYNADRFLADAIESVLRQTRPADEIIVVDDGSADHTAQVAGQFADRVRYTYQTNKGVAAARSRGIELATGDWIAFLDSDDVWYPQKLEVQLRALQLLECPSLIFSDHDAFREAIPRPAYHEQEISIQDVTLPMLLRRNTISTSTVILPKQWILDIGGLDTRYNHAEDWAVWLKLASQGKPIRCVQQPLTAYRLHPDSLSDRPVSLLMDIELQILNDFFKNYGRSVSRRVELQARAGVHLRACLDFAERNCPVRSIREALHSAALWPLPLPEYSTEHRLLRLRLQFRAFQALLRRGGTGRPSAGSMAVQ